MPSDNRKAQVAAAKVVVHDCILRARTESLPEHCPRCRALLTRGEALSVYEYSLRELRARLSSDGVVAGAEESSARGGLVTRYACARCGTELLAGESYRLTHDSSEDMHFGFVVLLRALGRERLGRAPRRG